MLLNHPRIQVIVWDIMALVAGLDRPYSTRLRLVLYDYLGYIAHSYIRLPYIYVQYMCAPFVGAVLCVDKIYTMYHPGSVVTCCISSCLVHPKMRKKISINSWRV